MGYASSSPGFQEEEGKWCEASSGKVWSQVLVMQDHCSQRTGAGSWLAWAGMCWTLKGGPGQERKGGKAHALPEFHLCSGQRCGRAAIHSLLSPGWASKPLTHSLGLNKGQPNLGAPGLLSKALGLWERGMRDERFPHWWEWAQWIWTGAMKAFHLEIRNGSLQESLSHPPSTVDCD